MIPVSKQLTTWMGSAFRAAFPEASSEMPAVEVVPTADPKFGDYQCNAAMALAKRLKMNPREVAQRVLDAGTPACATRLEIAGPGFINIALDDSWLASQAEIMQNDARLGAPCPGAGRTVVMDYSSPNVAKPMHIGHIRSTVIGNALDRLYRFLGYRVIADNHLGDWGTQFGLLIMGFRNFVDRAAYEAAPVEELERVYRESYERSTKDEAWMDAARRALVQLQAGDPDIRALWQSFIDASMREFGKIYARLDVRFDLTRGESYYNERLPDVIRRLRERGLAEEDAGALVVKLDEEKLPLAIVRKSDGGYNYTTTDIATVMSRVEEFHPDLMIYITDERQQLHFKQFFAICRRLGLDARLQHVWFGLMRLPEGTFSTRQGNVIKLERLLDEAEARALAMVRSASPEMDPERQAAVARAVGLGAVKYADLSQNPQSLVTFSWDKALALDGNSAPYLQYAYARIASVRDKYAAQFPDGDFMAAPIRLEAAVERSLVTHLLRFGDVVEQAAHTFRPNSLADYLYELAQLYSSFYQNVPFLKAPEGARESRVRLCDLVARVLRAGLSLLGIETPDRI